MRSLRSLLFVALGFALGLAGLALPGVSSRAQAQARDYRGRGSIQFVSNATLERITGRSRSLTGTARFDPANPASLVGSTFSVPINSIRTNNDLRDEHLRSANWLNAAQFPNATFEVTRVSGASRVEPNTAVRLEVTGNFTVHGVTREITAQARVRYLPDSNTFRIRASFRVSLPQHGVSVPAIVRLKVNDIIRANVSIDLRAG